MYFVSPTLANIRRITEDLEKSLYESFHLNFVEPLPRALLEELAAAVARDGTGELVEQVGFSRSYSYNSLNLECILGSRPIPLLPLTFGLHVLALAANNAGTCFICEPLAT